jgi:hypothetical protein
MSESENRRNATEDLNHVHHIALRHKNDVTVLTPDEEPFSRLHCSVVRGVQSTKQAAATIWSPTPYLSRGTG